MKRLALLLALHLLVFNLHGQDLELSAILAQEHFPLLSNTAKHMSVARHACVLLRNLQQSPGRQETHIHRHRERG